MSLTHEENAILDLLTEASRRFLRLPEHHPMDREEWCHEVHHLQQRLMCRSAIRLDPERFTPMEKKSPPPNPGLRSDRMSRRQRKKAQRHPPAFVPPPYAPRGGSGESREYDLDRIEHP